MSEASTRSASPGDRGQFASLVRGTTILVVVQMVIAVFAVAATVWAFMTLPDLQQQREDAILERDGAKAQVVQLKEESKSLKNEVASLEQRKSGMEDALPYIQAGAEALLRDEPAVALESFNSALTRLPDDPFITAQAAMAQFRVERVDLAIDDMRKAIAADPAKQSNYIELAGFYCRKQDLPQAIAVISGAPAEVKEALAQDTRLVLKNSFLAETCGPANTTRLASILESAAPGKADAFRIKRLYVQVRRKEDVAAAREISKQLTAAGYVVEGVEVVSEGASYRSSVRYYYDVQLTQATELADMLRKEAIARKMQVGAEDLMTLNLQGRFKGLSRDIAEVWF